MKFFYAYWLLFFLQFGLSAQNFAVKLIADSLMTNANTIVRINEGIFKVHSKDKCTFSTRIAYTILNKNDLMQDVSSIQKLYAKKDYLGISVGLKNELSKREK